MVNLFNLSERTRSLTLKVPDTTGCFRELFVEPLYIYQTDNFPFQLRRRHRHLHWLKLYTTLAFSLLPDDQKNPVICCALKTSSGHQA